MLGALDRAGMNFSVYPFNKHIESRRIAPFLEKRYDREGLYDIHVVYMAPDQLPFYFEALKQQSSHAKYRILRTFWELPEAPREWAGLLERIDELWVPNFFVFDAFRPIFDRNISIMPVSVDVHRSEIFRRDHFELVENRFYIMYSFDYYSFTARKNPAAVLHAFQEAFPNHHTNVGLIIKTTGVNKMDATV